MKRSVSVFLLIVLASFLAASCYGPYGRGAGTGAALGGVAGAILDSRNPWRGGVIGGVLGAIAGATITDISRRGAMEAAESGRTVEYRTGNGAGVYQAQPMGVDEQTHCRKVRERVWENGRLIKNTVKEVCTGEKYEPGY
ncbi:MAG: glycine zipper 2TM domain-containing protein [Nitrospiraceae bacterium]|nr:glycine zipper 2TM domain-containing protein [Nitrospiraceae bacterium]